MLPEGMEYPYLPDGKTIIHVAEDNTYIELARLYALGHALDRVMPGGAVITQDGDLLGWGTNGSEYHETHGCERVRLGCKSGEGYELCEGCSPKNHSEVSAINAMITRGNPTTGADLYLWGHWWVCKDCWEAVIDAGIRDVYLLERSWELFNKEHPNNIVGNQITYIPKHLAELAK